MKRLALGMACASALAWCNPARSEEPNQDPAKLFDSLDQNKDGIVTADEVGEDRKRFFERLVRVGDKNEDHKLSKDEFVASMNEQEKPVATPQGRFGGGDRPMFAPGQMFERMDRNRDGKFTKDEIPEQAPAELRERLERIFTAAGQSEVTREQFEKVMAKYGPPMGRPEGRRPEGPDGRPRPEGEREMAREEGRRDGDRPRGPEGERGREMARGEGRGPEGDRPRGPEADRMERGRMEAGPGPFSGLAGRGGRPMMSPLIRVLDRNEDGKLSRRELAGAADRFDELDRNGDGELDASEMMGPVFAGAPFGGSAFGRPGFGPGAMPREGADRDREMARDGDRRPEERRDAERRPDGPRDGDRPRPEAMRDGDRRPEGPRDGDRPRPEGRPDGGPRPGADRGQPMPRDGRGGGEIFARLDKNGDGVITKDEAPERMRNRFPDLDGNGDGKITAEELRDALARELGVPGEQRRERRPEME